MPTVTVPSYEKSVKGGFISRLPGKGDELNVTNDGVVVQVTVAPVLLPVAGFITEGRR